MLAGSFGAALLAGLIPTRPLAMMFTALVFYVGTQLAAGPQAEDDARIARGQPGLLAAGAVIGGVSSLAGGGRRVSGDPFLAWCSVPLRRAIGTASATGFPIASPGSAGMRAGLAASGLPQASLGLCLSAGAGLVVVTSMLAAPFGARLAHRLPVKRLRVVFALMFYALALRMLAGLGSASFADPNRA